MFYVYSLDYRPSFDLIYGCGINVNQQCVFRNSQNVSKTVLDHIFFNIGKKRLKFILTLTVIPPNTTVDWFRVI